MKVCMYLLPGKYPETRVATPNTKRCLKAGTTNLPTQKITVRQPERDAAILWMGRSNHLSIILLYQIICGQSRRFPRRSLRCKCGDQGSTISPGARGWTLGRPSEVCGTAYESSGLDLRGRGFYFFILILTVIINYYNNQRIYCRKFICY